MLRYRTVRLVWDYEGRNAKYNKKTNLFHDFSPCSEIVAGELVDMPPSLRFRLITCFSNFKSEQPF